MTKPAKEKPAKEKLNAEEFITNERLVDIKNTIDHLHTLCMQEPEASIILSLFVPSGNEDTNDIIAQLYSGEPIIQLMQLDMLINKNPTFEQTLNLFLAHRLKKQIKAKGSTGSKTIDQLLAIISKENTKKN